ncbi:MAG: S-layer homology domain-containing protein, partial [Faecousia sp.]
TCTAKRVCKNDASHVETAAATVTSEATKPATCTEAGETTYTATFTVEWATTQTKVIADIKPTGVPELNKGDHVAYIIGYTDGTVRPMSLITRAEVTTIFFRLLTDESRAAYWSQTNPYSDVTDDSWYNNAISTMTNAGIVEGYPDGSFRPDQPITRAEFVAIATRFSKAIYDGGNSFTDVPENHWAAQYIALAEQLGWIFGDPDGSFRPDQPITRAEAMTLINRMLERAVEEEHMLPDMISWPDNTPDAWYYEAVQEATNSHSYTRLDNCVPDQDFHFEHWLEILPIPNWGSLEKAWSDAYGE